MVVVPRTAVALLLVAAALVLPASPAAADVTGGLVAAVRPRPRPPAPRCRTPPATAATASCSGDASWSAGGAGLILGGTNGHVELPDNVLAGLDADHRLRRRPHRRRADDART